MNKTELKARCKELGIPTEGLTTNALLEEAIAKREAELEAEKAAAAETASEETVKESEEAVKEAAEIETNVSEIETSTDQPDSKEKAPEKVDDSEEEKEEEESEESQESARLVHEDKRGRKWGFKASAPKTLNIDGHPMSQEEIFDNEDVVSELVYGNSSFLTQINE